MCGLSLYKWATFKATLVLALREGNDGNPLVSDSKFVAIPSLLGRAQLLLPQTHYCSNSTL